jgi:hypothetical protein
MWMFLLGCLDELVVGRMRILVAEWISPHFFSWVAPYIPSAMDIGAWPGCYSGSPMGYSGAMVPWLLRFPYYLARDRGLRYYRKCGRGLLRPRDWAWRPDGRDVIGHTVRPR